MQPGADHDRVFDRERVSVLVGPFHGEAGVLVGMKIDPVGVDGQPVEARRFEELLGVFGFENDHVLADLDLVLAQGFAEAFKDGSRAFLPGVADLLRS